MTDPIAPEADVAAAELALGLLEGEERSAALRRQLAEPSFARDVERWRTHFASLFAAVPEVVPSTDLGERVVARLDGPARSRPGLWKPLAFASSLAAAGLLGVIVVQPTQTIAPVAPPAAIQPAPLVAAVMIEGKDAPMLAVYDAAQAQVRVNGAMDIPAGRSVQLWAIVEGDPTPHPLGLFKRAGTAMVADAPSPAPMPAGTTLAVSIEPLGGSPTGLPTGPVVGSGMLTKV